MDAADEGTLSRRRLLGGAGAAVAGGVAAVAATSAVVPAVAAATGGGVATGPSGSTALEFSARIAQDGSGFTAIGYLTQVAGLPGSVLFSDPDQRNETTALFTAIADGVLVARSVDGAVHNLDIEGKLAVYRRTGPGASFASPASFGLGRKLASYTLVLQDILTVIAPDTGVPTLLGELRQLAASSIGPGGAGPTFGRVGQRMRFFATGLGNRSIPDPPVATLSVAGNLTVA